MQNLLDMGKLNEISIGCVVYLRAGLKCEEMIKIRNKNKKIIRSSRESKIVYKDVVVQN